MSDSDKNNDEPESLLASDLSNELTEAEGQDPLVGQQIGKYSIVAKIARGGTATVYRAHDSILNREVAFKVLHQHLEAKKEVVERFRNEAKVVASLRHPNILTVFDFFQHEGRTVLVAELMPGITLSELIRRYRKIPESYALMITLEILQGLQVAHEKGITHRDIKPANILLHPEHGVKLSDFGLAKLTGSDDGLTKDGIFIGTPSFSSPEQIEGKPLDHRSDIFSLGLTLYMLVTGSHAFKQKGDTTTTVWFKIVRGSFQGVRDLDSSLSPEFERIIVRALQVNPEKRYPTAKEMIEDCSRLLKRRKEYPYSEKLKKFLKTPWSADGKPPRLFFLPKKLALLISAAVLTLGGLGALISYREEILGLFPKETQEPASREIAEPTQEESLESPQEPTRLPPPKTLPKPKRRQPKPVVTEDRTDGMTSSIPSLVLAEDSRVVVERGDRGFALRFRWDDGERFILSPNESLASPIVDADFDDQGFDWTGFEEGSYFWKAGDSNGRLVIETFSEYRSRVEVSKRDLSVSGEFNEVDLQINPWTQQLQLTWGDGPSADSYRVEVAKDKEFEDMIFSGTTVTKSTRIERLWEKQQSVFWRVSYLDASRNVFFIDPVRKINLGLSVSAPFFDVIEPRAYEELEGDKFRIKMIGPARSKIRCTSAEKDRPTGDYVELVFRNGYYLGNLPSLNGWLICHTRSNSERLSFSLPIRN